MAFIDCFIADESQSRYDKTRPITSLLYVPVTLIIGLHVCRRVPQESFDCYWFILTCDDRFLYKMIEQTKKLKRLLGKIITPTLSALLIRPDKILCQPLQNLHKHTN